MSKCLVLLLLFALGAERGFANTSNYDEKVRTKTVSTLLNAKWASTPTELEMSEFLNEEDPSYFWSFVEGLHTLSADLMSGTDKGKYEALLDLSRKYLAEGQISLLRFSLGLRVYSPKIEMFQQIALVAGVPKLNCPAVAQVNGHLTCNPEELSTLLKGDIKNPELYKLDHRYPGKSVDGLPVIILYGQIGTDSFNSFHLKLKSLAETGEVVYVVRHFLKERKGPKVRLSGYGVELQIKSTEYKAQDDTKVQSSGSPGSSSESENQSSDLNNEEEQDIEGFLFGQLKKLNPELSPKLDKLKQTLLDETRELAPLKVWQLQELSLQAAERILSSARHESLKIMAQLAQNFPLLARSLVKTTVRPALKEEIKKNQQRFGNEFNLQPSETALFINGQQLNIDSTDMFTLLEHLRDEVKIVEGIAKIGVPSEYVSSLISLDLTPPARQYAVDIRDSAILFINDIEKDPQYARWSSNIMELLRPSYPGVLRSIRRNMYNLVLVVDPVRKEARGVIRLAESFLIHNAPLRVGLVLAVDPDPKLTGRDDAGVAILDAFNYVAQKTNAVDALSFLTDLFALVGEEEVTVKDVEKLLTKKFKADLEDVLGEDSDYDVGRQLTKDFFRRTGFRKERLPQVLLNGVALDQASLNVDDFEEAVLTELMRQTTALQKALFKGEMREADNVMDFLMGQPNVMPRLNDRVLSTTGAKYLDLTGQSGHNSLTDMTTKELTATFADSVSYATSSMKPLTPITIWIVADVTQPSGRELIRNGLEYLRNSRLIRMSILHNIPADHPGRYPEALDQALAVNDLKLLDKLLQTTNAEDLMSGKKTAQDFGLEAVQKSSHGLALPQLLARRALPDFQPGQRGLIVNGRIIGPLDDQEEFTSDDFALLERHTMASAGEKILQFVQDLPQLHNADLMMRITGVLLNGGGGAVKTRHVIEDRGSELSLLTFPPKSEESPFVDITAIVDPISAGAQKLAPLLLVLQEVLNCRIRIFMNCVEKHSEMPLKSFYRLVLEPDLMFSSDERLLAGPTAKFGILPQGALLTQALQVPDNWLAESVWSPYDLDNIRLETVDSPEGVHSEYELENLILEGHCFDASSGSPPRGLQLTLGTTTDPLKVDTIVMANLGYLQLKANPGSWILRLREGRSSDIYSVASHEGTDTPTNQEDEDIHVLISSFKSHTLKLKVAKKPGKQHMDLLSTDEEDGDGSGLWNSITSTFSSTPGKSADEEDEKLNIFSLASGHLYERFIRIMMLSVLKHTKTPVKFWFLKQYLSPTLKDFLPAMAAEYGFEYELVQYKWPRWLHQQTEKQRIIWGYKILFLDVLFPLSVKKIIFVDADQIVRADLKELRDLDLGSAPYGYTPFCDSRTEMEGFRFWKSGYWRNHLQGRKYHISALYVVDLKRFRKIAAGDRLRGQYQALSQDPNSLSNLDQDLPNNMIHQVPIKSLPQEWLWCETWCDNVSKQKAKTIDLCNNPQTKEAKLDAAVRIVSEWTDYDSEIKRLQESLARNRTIEKSKHDPAEL